MKRPLAPSLPPADPNAPADPIKAFAERRKAAIDSRVGDPHRTATEAAGVDGATTPPKAGSIGQTPSPTRSKASPEPPASQTNASAGPASDTSSTKTEDAKPLSTDSPAPTDSAEKGPRYDLKSFKRWAEKNPEEAIEFSKSIGVDVFRENEDPKQEWIRQQQKARKIKEDISSREAALSAKNQAELAQIKAEREAAEAIGSQLAYIGDMWAAAKRVNAQGQPDPDFDTIDEAFRQNSGGMTIDEYNRARARRGVANPEVARLRAENARLLARVNAGQAPASGATAAANGAATPSAMSAATPPAVSEATKVAAPLSTRDPEAFWGDDVPKTHALRQFAGWATELDAEMSKYHDETLDEYSKDPEEIADKLLARKIAAFAADEEEEAPAPARKPAAKGKPNVPKRRAAPEGGVVDVPGLPAAAKLVPRGKVNTDRSHKVVTKDEIASFDGGAAERRRFAIDRAMRRARGEPVEDVT